MKLYTFQPNFIWQTIQDKGFYHPFDLFEKDSFLKEDLTQDWGFAQSYMWLKEKMVKKGISYQNHNDHMIWAWKKWSGKKEKPDKRYASVYAFYDKPFVMMELDIDSSRVLLSDYESWYFVLNYSYLAHEKDVENFSAKFKHFRKKPYSDKKADLEMRESWNNIFDLEKSRSILEYPKEEQCIQATFFEIFKSDVKKVHYFENKRCIKMESF